MGPTNQLKSCWRATCPEFVLKYSRDWKSFLRNHSQTDSTWHTFNLIRINSRRSIKCTWLSAGVVLIKCTCSIEVFISSLKNSSTQTELSAFISDVILNYYLWLCLIIRVMSRKAQGGTFEMHGWGWFDLIDVTWNPAWVDLILKQDLHCDSNLPFLGAYRSLLVISMHQK